MVAQVNGTQKYISFYHIWRVAPLFIKFSSLPLAGNKLLTIQTSLKSDLTWHFIAIDDYSTSARSKTKITWLVYEVMHYALYPKWNWKNFQSKMFSSDSILKENLHVNMCETWTYSASLMLLTMQFSKRAIDLLREFDKTMHFFFTWTIFLLVETVTQW